MLIFSVKRIETVRKKISVLFGTLLKILFNNMNMQTDTLSRVTFSLWSAYPSMRRNFDIKSCAFSVRFCPDAKHPDSKKLTVLIHKNFLGNVHDSIVVLFTILYL